MPSSNRSQLVLTAYFRSVPVIGLQTGSPSIFTITAGVLLKNTLGGSAFTPSTFFGRTWLLSMLASTRSSAITRACCGMPLVISATISCTCGLARVGKFDSVIRRTEKSTSRSVTDTLVSASALIVPSAGLSPALAV